MSSGSGGGLNIFGRYLGGGGNKRNAGANANGNGAPGGSSSNREPHNLPKILRATVDTGREVNVIEAKAARSQPKKVVSMISSPVVTRSHSPARPPIHSSSSAVTPTGSPLLQKRMQFKINVTPSGKGSSSTPLNSKSLRSTTCECDVNGNRLNFVNNKTTTTGATGGDLRCSIDVVKENNLARLFGSKSSSSSKQTSNSNTFTRSRTNKADSGSSSGGLSNFAVNFNVALNMERSDAHEEIDLPRGAAHKEAAENKGGDEQGTAAAAAAASASLEDIYSDPMTADTSIEQARKSSGDGGQRLSLSLDTASSLKVAVRLRPFSAAEAALSSGKALDVLIKDDQVLLPHRKEYFKFDHCLNSSDQELFNYADQETVYRKMGEPLLEYAFRGYNTCLFAYGQSGSGKTYTMMGSEVVPGIIPRFLNDLFKRISSPRASYLPSGTTTTTTTEYIVNVSFMEIYNEKIHDLLADQFEAIRKGPLKVREHPETGPFVEDLTVYTVESYENAMELLASGNERRTTASTAANEQSSRSHTIFTVILVQNKTVTNGGGGGGGGDEPGWGQPQQEQPEESTTSTTISKVHLVDLAGSERASAVSAAKDRQREGTFINKSLLTLGKVISQLAEAAKTGPSSSSSLKAAGGEAAEQTTNGNSAHPHIPYRDSTLTFLLKDSLGGNSRTSMIATISPAKEHLEETVSTLRYASTASKIVNVVHVNEDPKIQIINSLLKQISFLKREVESATAAAAAVKSSEEQQQQQPKQFETTAAPPPAVVPPPPPPTSSTEPKEKEEEIAVSVDVNLDESKDVEDGSTAEFASAPTSPPSFAPPASPSPATAATAALPEDYCSGACTKRITVKLEQLDGKFNQLLQNQRSFEEKLAGFVETVAASSPPPPSTGSKTLEALPPSLAMSSKVVDELKSLLAKVKSESAGIGKDKDKDFEALLKSMESPAAAVDDDYLEDDDHHLLATVETSRKEEAASKDSPPAVATAAISAWTSKGNHIHNNISNKDKPMITKPMNEKEKKAAEAAQKAADAAQRRQEEKEAREAKQKKEEEEAAKRKEEAEKKEAEAKKEAREKAEQEKAEKVAKQKEEKEAREAKRKEEEAAEAKKKADEKEAREKADKEKADKVAKQKAEKEAAEEKKKQEEKAEREAKQKAEKEAKEAKRKEEEAAEAKKKADKEKAEKEKAEKEAAEAKKKAQAEEEEAKKKAEEEAAAAEAEKKKAEEEEAATKAANDNDDDDDGFMPLSKKDKRKLLKAKKFEAAEEEVEEEVTPAAASAANSDDDDNDFELPPKNLKGNALKKWKKEQREKNLAKLKKATEEAKEKVEVDEEKGEEEKEEVAARPPKKLTPKEQKKLDREKKKADKKNKKGKKGGGGDSDESGDDGEEEEEEAKFTIELGKNQKKDGDDSDDEAKSGKKKAKKGKKGK